MKIFAPATIGNFSVGFDLLGLAIQPIDGTLLGDIIEISEAEHNSLSIGGDYYQQLPEATDNLVSKAHRLFEQELEGTRCHQLPSALGKKSAHR